MPRAEGAKFLQYCINALDGYRRQTYDAPQGGGLGPMPDYRVYVIGRDGHIVDCKVISCDDDQAAVRSAERMLRRDTLELWRMEQARRVQAALEMG